MSRIDRSALVSILGEVASMMLHAARWSVEGSDEESRFWMRHEAFNGLAEAVELWAVQAREDGLPSEEQELEEFRALMRVAAFCASEEAREFLREKIPQAADLF